MTAKEVATRRARIGCLPQTEDILSRICDVYWESQNWLPFDIMFKRKMQTIHRLSDLHYHPYNMGSKAGNVAKKLLQKVTQPFLKKQVQYNRDVRDLMLTMGEAIQGLSYEVMILQKALGNNSNNESVLSEGHESLPEEFSYNRPISLSSFENLIESSGILSATKDDEPGAYSLDLVTPPALRSKSLAACFSPFRPMRSGISDYTEALLTALSTHLKLDLYHDRIYTPSCDLAGGAFTDVTYPDTQFDRINAVKHYNALIYQMGNNSYHSFAYNALLRYGGISVIHDYHLGNLMDWYCKSYRMRGQNLERELRYCYPSEMSTEIIRRLNTGESNLGTLNEEGIHLNKRVFDRSLGVIVHSRWAYDAAKRDFPDAYEYITHVPLVTPVVVSRPNAREASRATLGIPQEAFVVSTFGFLGESKRALPVLEAFGRFARVYNNARLEFVGSASPDMKILLDKQLEILGIQDRVRVTGFVEMERFCEHIEAADICLNLRFPYHGETSAALLQLLAYGKPVIVTDIGSFSEFSDDVVLKLPTPDHGDEVKKIYDALMALAADPQKRQALGQRAAEYTARVHSPENCARLYAEFINKVLDSPSAKRKILADYVGREAASMEIKKPEEFFRPYAEKINSLPFSA